MPTPKTYTPGVDLFAPLTPPLENPWCLLLAQQEFAPTVVNRARTHISSFLFPQSGEKLKMTTWVVVVEFFSLF
jgi:hypothetical protein